jgi:hypothetical protein
MKLTAVFVLLLLSVAAPAQNNPAFHGDIASWSGIPPLPPGTKPQSFPGAVHCNVGDAVGHMVSIWTTEKGCAQWLDEAKKLAASGPTNRQVTEFQDRQREALPIERNTVYALFLCFQGTCQLTNSTNGPIVIYHRLADCQHFAQLTT